MGLFHKNQKPQPTFLERKRNELRQEEINSADRLEGKTHKALSTYFAINVLPEGPDKNAMKKRYDDATYGVLCEIGEHDAIVRQYNEVNKKCGNSWVEVRNSHDIIVNSVREYFSK